MAHTMYRKNQHTHKQQKPDYRKYIAHKDEPRESLYGEWLDHIDPELEQELAQNRFFLKRRVWKSAKKFKKPSTELY